MGIYTEFRLRLHVLEEIVPDDMHDKQSCIMHSYVDAKIYYSLLI